MLTKFKLSVLLTVESFIGYSGFHVHCQPLLKAKTSGVMKHTDVRTNGGLVPEFSFRNSGECKYDILHAGNVHKTHI